MQQAIPDKEINRIVSLYEREGFTLSKIAEEYRVSIDAVFFIMKKHGIKRRTDKEVQKLRFLQAKQSLKRRQLDSIKLRELAIAGSMLYWAEGYKGSVEKPAKLVDFANSDPGMIRVFLNFLRSVYELDESKFRIYLYHHSNEKPSELIAFWEDITGVSSRQFSKPYVKATHRNKVKRMPHGLIHVRYHDKKLLLDIKNMIDYYMHQYAPIE